MSKYHFIIVGSGWRSLYYVRVAKALPDIFQLDAMLCRTKEKADKMAEELSINTTTSIQECVDYKPDFAVIAVNKSSGCEIAMEWMDRGITVLSETPAALSVEQLKKLYEYYNAGKKQVVAEQYRNYPSNKAAIRLIKSGILGDVSCMNISLAHEYHGFSLIRAYLGITAGDNYNVSAKIYEFPTTQTLTRYDKYMDGRVADKKRCIATFEFDNGKVAWYDFDSEQYRSPIRKNTVKVQGVRGEMIDDTIYYLDDNNEGCTEKIKTEIRTTVTDNENPNLSTICEVEKITCNGKVLYEPEWGMCNLTEDETAIAALMEGTAMYSRGEADSPYPIEDALADAYTAILLEEAAKTGKKIYSKL